MGQMLPCCWLLPRRPVDGDRTRRRVSTLNGLCEQAQRPSGVVADFLAEDALKLVLILCSAPEMAQCAAEE